MQLFWQKFLRQKQSIIYEIDGLRGLAIFAVVFSHFNLQIIKLLGLDETFLYSNPQSRFLELCGNGVNIFFCISAFILSIPFIQHYLLGQQKVVLKRYYLKRITRLEIPYLLVLTILYLLQLVFLNQDFRTSINHYLSSFFYSHNIVYGRRSTINPVAWTLEIEIQLYILLPFLVKLFCIKNTVARRLVLLSLMLVSGFLYAYYNNFFIAHNLQYSIFAYLPVFFCGFLLADLYVSKQLIFTKHWLIDIIGVVAFLAIIYYSGDSNFFVQITEYAGYCFLFYAAFNGKLLNIFFTKKWLMALGAMCYSIYLIHFAIIFFLVPKISTVLYSHNYYKCFTMICCIVIPIILLCSMAFYYFIEKPFVNKN